MKAAVCAILLCLVAIVAAQYPYQQPYYYGYYGYPGNYGYNGYNGYLGYAQNHEYDYRQFPGYPVHVGNGQFYFLGIYGGSCDASYNYGFYFAAKDTANSFVVCDHGRAHRFQCPKGTKNHDQGYYVHNNAYGFNELCGEHTNEA